MLADHLAALHDFQDDFLASITFVEPTAPVPHCEPWTVTDLVMHLAEIHHWAAAKASSTTELPLVAPRDPDPATMVEFYGDQAVRLRTILGALDLDARAWTLTDQGVPRELRTGTVRFWHRRQALEVLVHTWDLRAAGGLPYDPGPDAWLDCLDEVVTIMHPRQVRLGRILPPAVRVRFAPDDVATTWELTGAPAGAPEVTLAGPAKTLALLAWGRATTADVTVTGDRAALAAVLAPGLTP